MIVSPAVTRRCLLLATTALGSGALITLATLTLGAPAAHANPVGGRVVGGDATIAAPARNRVEIRQSTDRAAINWESFSIGRGEVTEFVQPGRDSITLNRVVGPEGGRPPLSEIAGQLQANGNVMLVNPSGVVFTPTAQIDVGGLLASTSDLDPDHFMTATGRFQFTPGAGDQGFVRNEGSITVAEGGLAALVAPYVANYGVIDARLGRVELASGSAYTVDFYGDGLIHFEAGSAGPRSGVVPAGFDANVANGGWISATGGVVRLSVDGAIDVVDRAINMDGIVEAGSISSADGRIVLHGGDDGAVRVTGRLDASGQDAGTAGGEVVVAGNRIDVESGALIDVSGPAGGGDALLGAGVRGAPIPALRPDIAVADAAQDAAPIPVLRPAQVVTVQAGARIAADATERGDGGTIVAWADGATLFDGTATARGGPGGGDGGFVETSGDRLRVAEGMVDTSAPNGLAGQWLLDPTDIRVIDDDVGTSNLASVDQFLDPNNAGAESLVFGSAIEAAASDVVLQATDTIQIQTGLTLVNAGVGLVAQAGGDVVVTSPVATSGGTIHLEADSPHTPGVGADGNGEVTLRETGSTPPSLPLLSSNGGAVTIIGSNLRLESETNFTSGVPFIDAGNGTANIAFTDGTINLAGDLSAFFAADTLINGQATTAGTNGLGANPIVVDNDLVIADPVVFPANVNTVILASDLIRIADADAGSLQAAGSLIVRGDIVSPGEVSIAADSIELQNVDTSGDQTLTGDVLLGGTHRTNGGDFSVAGDTMLGASLTTIDTTDTSGGGTVGGTIMFGGAVDTAVGAVNDLTLVTGTMGDIVLNAPVGGQVPLGTLTRLRLGVGGGQLVLGTAAPAGPEDAGRDPGTAPIALDIDVQAPGVAGGLNPGDLNITIGGIPPGAQITIDGASVPRTGDSVTISGTQLDGLGFIPAPDSSADVTLTVDAVLIGGGGGFDPLPAGSNVASLVDQGAAATPVRGQPLQVAVTAVPDAATANLPQTVVLTPRLPGSLVIRARSGDTDGSETVDVRLSGFPPGTSIPGVTANSDGSFTVPANELDGLRVIVPLASPDRFALDVSATASDTDPDGGTVQGTQTALGTVQVTVDQEAPEASNQTRTVQDQLVSTQDVRGFAVQLRPARLADTSPLVEREVVFESVNGASGAFIPADLALSTDPEAFISAERQIGTEPGGAGEAEEEESAGDIATAEAEEVLLLELEQIEACPDVALPTVAWQNTATESAFNVDSLLVPYSVDVFCAGYKIARPNRGEVRAYEGMTFVLSDFWTDLRQARTPEPIEATVDLQTLPPPGGR